MQLFNCPSTLTSNEIGASSEISKKYLVSGYRHPNKPWSYYVFSLFQAHNQTVNIWTHLLGFLYIVYRTYELSFTFDFINDSAARPLGSALLCISLLLLISCFAHWFSEVSELGHYTCFYVDFAGIGIHAMGCSISSHAYLIKDRKLAFFICRWSSFVCICLAIQVTVLLSYSKIQRGRTSKFTTVFKGIAIFSSYFWFLLPLIYRYLWPSDSDVNLVFHKWHIIYFFLDALVYVTHIPERWFPVTFDLVGASHQIHHILLLFMSHCFIEATLKEISSASPNVLRKYILNNRGSVWSSYGTVLFTIYLNCFVIVAAHLAAIEKVARCGKKVITDESKESNGLKQTCDEANYTDDSDDDDDDDDDDDSLYEDFIVDKSQ